MHNQVVLILFFGFFFLKIFDSEEKERRKHDSTRMLSFAEFPYAARFQNFFNSSGGGSGCKLVTTPVPTVLFSASRKVNRTPFSMT